MAVRCEAVTEAASSSISLVSQFIFFSVPEKINSLCGNVPKAGRCVDLKDFKCFLIF